jgi:hypothetical protein
VLWADLSENRSLSAHLKDDKSDSIDGRGMVILVRFSNEDVGFIAPPGNAILPPGW